MSLALRRRSRSVRQTQSWVGCQVSVPTMTSSRAAPKIGRKPSSRTATFSAFANLSNMRNAESTSRVSAKGQPILCGYTSPVGRGAEAHPELAERLPELSFSPTASLETVRSPQRAVLLPARSELDAACRGLEVAAACRVGGTPARNSDDCRFRRGREPRLPRENRESVIRRIVLGETQSRPRRRRPPSRDSIRWSGQRLQSCLCPDLIPVGHDHEPGTLRSWLSRRVLRGLGRDCAVGASCLGRVRVRGLHRWRCFASGVAVARCRAGPACGAWPCGANGVAGYLGAADGCGYRVVACEWFDGRLAVWGSSIPRWRAG